ncbi:diguanylate cyclase [Phormidium sp. CCY1219]|uniref:diguanylate cyclase n=1 Tax=Phormidium sp. CCY1219 TaxID=2886104 RepID=UPI002D1E96A1|nr:diguanylate cyclase [Phormidium sp. CCY1219]MEB3826459.1 diguanylate cyclase [Phormidium sp. CCY1219]
MFVDSLRQAIDGEPITTTADTPLSEAIALMSRGRSSCVLVVDRPPSGENKTCRLLGIWTERDVVRRIASAKEFQGVTIGEVMTTNVITLQDSPGEERDIVTALSLFRQHRIRHLPVLDMQGQFLGIITHQSIRGVLKPIDFMRLRRVIEVMNPRVIHAPRQTSVLHLAKLMALYNVSCVTIAEHHNSKLLPPSQSPWGGYSADSCQIKAVKPVGIVTERDVVQFRNLELDLEGLCAEKVMSTPLFPITPEASLWEAHQQMQRRHVQRLVVTGPEGELAGIITQTSLLQALDPMEMYAEIEVLQQLLQQSESEREALLKQLIARNKLLESLALTDALTGLPNRRAMEQAMPQMLPQPDEVEEERWEGYVCVFAIDVDYFKRVNDTYGHSTGDLVLKEIAARLQETARSNSWFYRYGGEEFVCITPGISPQTAREYGESLRRAIAYKPFKTSDRVAIPVTISIGCAIANLAKQKTQPDEQLLDPLVLLDLADRALYQAKGEGRNCLRIAQIADNCAPDSQPPLESFA